MIKSTSPLSKLAFACTLLLFQCQPSHSDYAPSPDKTPQNITIEGRSEYLASPYVTAGDRLYMVGHQDGTFPDLGWHVTGEMGGIWDHPIKLMDGFSAAVEVDSTTHCLNNANTFLNFPFGNQHNYSNILPGINVERFQFAPDHHEAIIIEYRFQNATEEAKGFTFTFNGMADLRPVWLGERTGMIDGNDIASWDSKSQCLVAKDSLNDWYVVWGSTAKATNHQLNSESCHFERLGKGINAALSYDIQLQAGENYVLPIVIAGSYHSLDAAKRTLQTVQKNKAQLLKSKQTRYQQLAQTTKLTIPDKKLQQVFEWVKYNTDWLIRDVPETGRALSAGIPDYPWWFGCDNTYALQGVLATGRTDIVYSTLNLIHRLSAETNDNGRIIHEASTNGAIFNPGNINETPHFASMVWTVYEWTGDKEFLEKYYPAVQKGLSWLLAENDDDGNLLPDGFGMMEIHGMDSEMVDVAVYTQQAFADAARMADAMNELTMVSQYQHTADRLREKINSDFWVPEFNSYADFIGTIDQANRLIDDAIVRADTLGKPWAVEELKATKAKIASYPPEQKLGFVLHHNWVVNTPMEMGIADPEKALLALETGGQFVNPYGVFVTGIDRDETAGTDESSFAAGKKVFSYTGAVMTLPTGVMAIAENNYGRPDQALDYLQRLTRSFSFALPGSIYEVSPDFGMMTQAWNIYSLAVPIVQQFFGVKPMAYQQTVQIQPQMPTAWENARLENIIVGDNQLSIQYQKDEDGTRLQINQSLEDWTLRLAFPAAKYKNWQVNGKEVQPETEDGLDWVEVEGKEVVLNVTF